MAAKLTALSRGDAIRLLKAFSSEFEQDGDKITGNGRDGRPYSIHLDHGKGLRPDQLSRALRYVGISRGEFDAWRKA